MGARSESMTSGQRICAAMRREPVDYVPFAPYFNPQDPVQRRGRVWNFPFGPSHAEAVEYCVERLGLDMVVQTEWQPFFPDPSVSSSVWIEGSVLHKRWHTPSGDLGCAVRYDSGWPHGFDVPFFTDHTIGRFVKPWLERESDLECLAWILKSPRTADQLDLLRFYWNEAHTLADRHRLATMVNIGMGLTGAHQLCDSQKLCLLTVENPDLVDAYLELEHCLNMENLEIALDFGVDIVRRNGFYETCDFFSPTYLSGVLAERLRSEASAVHQAGDLIGYTVLTGYTPMVEHLASVGFDCIITPDPFFRGENPELLIESMAAAFWTGPSDTLHMPWDDQEAVRSAVRRVFERFGTTGLILSPCSSSKAIHPWANMLAMVDEWKKLR